MEETIKFYEGVLRFRRVADHMTRIKEGGTLRQVYFEVGESQFLVFMEPKGIATISPDYDTGINAALGLPAGMYHVAFKIDTLNDLEMRREALDTAGVAVSQIVDLGAAKSFFLRDPNDIQLEFCCHIRPFDDEDLLRESEGSIAPTG